MVTVLQKKPLVQLRSYHDFAVTRIQLNDSPSVRYPATHTGKRNRLGDSVFYWVIKKILKSAIQQIIIYMYKNNSLFQYCCNERPIVTKVKPNLMGWQLLKCFLRNSQEVERADLKEKQPFTINHFKDTGKHVGQTETQCCIYKAVSHLETI